MKKWNKKRLLAAVPGIAKELKIRDFEGKTAEEFLAWTKSSDSIMEFPGLDTDADIITAFKTVTIIADAGEEIVVPDPDDIDGDPEEVVDGESKAQDDDEEDKQDRDDAKAFYAQRKAERKALRHSQNEITKGFNGIGMHTLPGSKRFGDANSVVMKSYDNSIKTGAILSRSRKTPLFLNAERCEWFGAKARSLAMHNHDYPQKAADELILSRKTGLVGINSTGGSLVFGEDVPELIENLEEGGVAREMIGITAMREGQRQVAKLNADVTVTDGGEAEVIATSDPTVGNVELIASKTSVLVRDSNELLNDAAFNIGEIIARSIMRATGIFEDTSVFLGSNNRQGIANLVGPTSTHDAMLTANWSEFNIQDIQDWLGLLPSWAMRDPNFGIVCSLPFYMRVLRRFALSASGTTGDSLLGGINGGFQWDGIKVGIAQVMPLNYLGNQLVAFAGAWSHATKFGVVTGSERLDVSDQRFFDEDLIAWRRTQRWAFNGHDVNDTTNSGIVALQD